MGEGRVLDVGCANGRFHELIYREGVYGLDIIDKCSIRKNFFAGDAQDMPFKNNFFDVVVAGELIEHLDNPHGFMSEAMRVLKKGGLLLLSTPNKNSFYNRFTKRYEHKWHKNLFDKESLVEAVGGHGFEVKEFFIVPYDEVSSWGSRHNFVIMLRRFVSLFLPDRLKEDMLLAALKK